MIFSDSNVRVWLYQRATDMRKSFKGLIALVKNQLREDPLSGHLFVFINKRKTYMKILYYTEGGFCIWSKKLTQGQYALNENVQCKHAISWHDLQCLIEGVDVKVIRQRKRYNLREKTTKYDYNIGP